MPNKRAGGGVNNRVGWKFPGYLISGGGGFLINGGEGGLENQKIIYFK